MQRKRLFSCRINSDAIKLVENENSIKFVVGKEFYQKEDGKMYELQ